MGQHVSVDAGLDVQDLLRLGGALGGPEKGGASSLPPGIQHHVRAWRFESKGPSVADSPVPLRGDRGLADLQLSKDSSYLILHVYSEGADGGQDGAAAPSCDIVAALGSLATQAAGACTPRGLSIAQCQATPRNPAEACGVEGKLRGDDIRFSLYVWHGVMADARTKARSLSKAFLLEQQLLQGLLQAQSFAELVQRAPSLPASGQRSDAGVDAAAAVAAASPAGCSNELLVAVLGSGAQSQPLSGGRHRGRAVATPQTAGAQRFQRLGQSVWKSLEKKRKASGEQESKPEPQQWAAQRVEPSQEKPATVRTVAPGVPSLALPTAAAAKAAAAPPPKLGLGGAAGAVPKLALGGLGGGLGGAVGHDPNRPQPMTAREAAPAEHADAAQKPAFLPANGAQTERKAPVIGMLNLPSRSEPEPLRQAEQAPPSDRSDSTYGTSSECSSSDRSADRSAERSVNDAPPAMLNLEEINMSEQELIDSYDPDNEENNYHLPNHILKRLQLGRFRQDCSEAVPGALFISGYQVPSTLEILKRHGITHIVNMAADVCDNCFPDDFEYCTYYMKDANWEDLTPVFYRTIEWIEQKVAAGGRVLVHCREGVSRSATITIAYMMWTQQISFETAHERLRKVRPICNPNTGFTCQLLMLGKRLGIGAGGKPPPPPDKLTLFRVSPHHQKEPFLLFVPAELQQSAPALDPRFGWVLQRGKELVLWLGAQVPNEDAVQQAVHQHARWWDKFEKRQCDVTVVQQGAEPLHFWQLLGMQAAPADPSSIVSLRPALDADFEIMKA